VIQILITLWRCAASGTVKARYFEWEIPDRGLPRIRIRKRGVRGHALSMAFRRWKGREEPWLEETGRCMARLALHP